MYVVWLIVLYTCVRLLHSTCLEQQQQHRSDSQSHLHQTSHNCIQGILTGGSSVNLQSPSSCLSDSPEDTTNNKGLSWGENTVLDPKASGKCAIRSQDTDQVQVHNITKIGVQYKQDTGAFQLSVRSSLYAYNSCQFTLNLVNRDNPPSDEGICKLYHIESNAPQAYFQVSFTDTCFVDLLSNKTYDLNVTSSQNQFLRIYRIFTPPNLRPNTVAGLTLSGSIWSPVVGVSLHSRTVTVYIERLPDNPPTHSYLLQLAYSTVDGYQVEGKENSWVRPAEDFKEFRVLDYSYYTVRIYQCDKQPSVANTDPTTDKCSLVQEHSFSASAIHTNQQDASVTSDMDSTTTSDVEVVPQNNADLMQKQDLYILLGTIFGVIFLVVVIAIIVFVYFKRRQGSHHGLTTRFSGGNVYSDGLLYEEDAKNTPPTVLLLYSYDCQQHLSCVQSFALLLQNALGCSVMADFWATQEIAERGIHLWLQHKIATVNYIIVVCSTGARFKSVTNRRSRLEENSDDAYILAMKALQSKSDTSGSQKMVVYFDYSCESDIPVLLENWQRYKLMQDIDLFIPSLIDICTKDGSTSYKNDHEQVYVKKLHEQMKATKQYMMDNTDWFHANLQPNICCDTEQLSSVSTTPPPLTVVTVEHNRSRPNSAGDGESDQTGSAYVTNPKRSVTLPQSLPPYYSSSTQKDPVVKSQTENGGSSLYSYSSSIEDLEHDIHFILNPTLPSKARFMPTYIGFSDLPQSKFPSTLPDLLPGGNILLMSAPMRNLPHMLSMEKLPPILSIERYDGLSSAVPPETLPAEVSDESGVVVPQSSPNNEHRISISQSMENGAPRLPQECYNIVMV